jgi:hypothetical protein
MGDLLESAKNPPLWSRIFNQDPYESFDVAAYEEDLQGWGSIHPIFEVVLAAVQPSTILEVGTWKGASAINMARIAKKLGLTPDIICIDTFLGTIESYIQKDSYAFLHEALVFKNGWPNLYYQFLANVVKTGFQDQIVPLPQTSMIGLRLLNRLGIRPEVIYLDASHDYKDAKDDLELIWECLSDDGILFGDDYMGWPGVTRAVNEFCVDKKLIVIGGPGKFAVAKRGNIMELFGEKNLVQSDGSCGDLKVCRPLV